MAVKHPADARNWSRFSGSAARPLPAEPSPALSPATLVPKVLPFRANPKAFLTVLCRDQGMGHELQRPLEPWELGKSSVFCHYHVLITAESKENCKN